MILILAVQEEGVQTLLLQIFDIHCYIFSIYLQAVTRLTPNLYAKSVVLKLSRHRHRHRHQKLTH